MIERVSDGIEKGSTFYSRKAAKTKTMTDNEIAKIVVDAAYHIHRMFGPGLLQSF